MSIEILNSELVICIGSRCRIGLLQGAAGPGERDLAGLEIDQAAAVCTQPGEKGIRTEGHLRPSIAV
jgi:hypothetical protein